MYKRFALAALALGMLAGGALAAPPAGFEIVEAAGDVGYSRGPGMNDCGALVFVVRRPEEFESIEVFRYDNGLIERVTYSNGVGADLPGINNAGTIVWSTDEFPYDRMFMRTEHGELELGFGSGRSINESGHVLWKFAEPPFTCEYESNLFFYDGAEVHQITSESLSNQYEQINDRDDLVWARIEFCEFPAPGHVISYFQRAEQELTERRYEAREPRINNTRRVAWGSPEGLDIWEDGVVHRVYTGPQFPDAMNNFGQIVIERYEHARSANNFWLLSDWPEAPTLERITDDANTINAQAAMNDWGEVAWMRRDTNTNVRSIRYMRRIRTGDSEFDGDIDHDDLAKLVDCMTGPGWVERTDPGPEDSLCDCRFLDINHDGGVDLRDYAMFQENFGQ